MGRVTSTSFHYSPVVPRLLIINVPARPTFPVSRIMSVDPKSVIKKKAADKEQAKKFKTYGAIGLVVIVLFVIFFHAESQANASHSWATNYERKCEACQTMIVSGIWTRSMIAQQEMKRIEADRQESGNAEPLTPEEKSPPVKAGVVLRYMCADQQIDHLLRSCPLTFGDGFTSNEGPAFAAAVKKLCWYAMNNDTVTTTFKKMLETPMTQMQNPTLISISKVHATSVCVQKLGSCSEAQLEPGMVDVPMANQQNRPDPRVVEEVSGIPEDLDQQRPEVVGEETEL